MNMNKSTNAQITLVCLNRVCQRDFERRKTYGKACCARSGGSEVYGSILRLVTLFMMFLAGSGIALGQTITPQESSVLLISPKKIGLNIGGNSYYGSGQLYKNLIARNPGFESDLYRQKFVAFANGSTASFPSPGLYDPVVANFWSGASFRLYRGNPKALVCSGSIASNTASTATSGPVYTFASACSSAVAKGDVIVLRQVTACTPEADWEGNHAGWWMGVSGGGKILSDCTTPYDGRQSVRLDASVAGSTAGAGAYLDNAPTVVAILFNGQFTISGFYKTGGTPTFQVSAQRHSPGSAGNPFYCPAVSVPPSTAWAPFSVVCNGTETNAVAEGPVTVNFDVQGGVVELDDVAFQKSSGNDSTNTTPFRDEVLAFLRKHCAGASLTGVPCELRYWSGQNADEIDNAILPTFKRKIPINTYNYDYAGGQGYPSELIGLEEFLQLCLAVNAEPYYALPETTYVEEGSKWIEYLNGATSTPYGAKRAANGHSASWLSTFPTVHLAMGNENWNEGGAGEGLGYRGDAPDFYYDYSTDAAGVWGNMRASTSWPAGGNGIDLVLGFQDGNPNYGVVEAMTRTNANSGELAPYTQFYVGDTTPLTALWNPLMYEVVANTTNSQTTFFQQAGAIKNYGRVNVYEFDNSTLQGPTTVTQAVLDSFTDAAGYGTATALQSLQHLAYGIVDQNFFGLSGYCTGGPNNTCAHVWGAVIDMGGATNAIRPQELGMEMVNAAIIGPMYSCTVSAPTTYNLAANHNGQSSSGTPAANNIPQQYAYCFMSGTKRSMVVINVDVTNSHAVSFSGPQAPTGSVTLTRYAPSSISARNEAGGTDFTDGAPQNVSINAATTVVSPSGDTLPPYSITRYDWTAGSGGSLASTTTSLTASPTAVAAGASVTLTATESPSAATGTVTFKDGSTTLGTATLSSGSAAYIVSGITAGSHSFTASYGGNASYAASTSGAVSVTASGSYVHTTFNEYAAGHALNETVPATAPAGSSWTDPNGDWTFKSDGGMQTAGSDLGYPILINASAANYTATIAFSPANNLYALFRYVDLSNYLFVRAYSGEMDLFSRIGGNESRVAVIYPTATGATSVTVTLNGATATISSGGQAASGTIPSGQPSSNNVGFLTPAASLITSLDIAPITSGATQTSTTTSLAASSTNQTAGASVTLTASLAPSAATGSVTFSDGASTLGSANLSGGKASYIITNISAGSHSFTANYSGSSSFASSTSNSVVVTANSGSLVHTTFNEYPAGHALNGTIPATAPAGSNWTDPNLDWTFASSSGMQTTGSDLGNPILTNTSAANYTATIGFSPANNLYALFRYVDLSNYLFVRAYSGEIDLFSRIGGNESKVAVIYPTATGATSVTVTLNGSAATINSGGQTASGTIPSGQPTSNNVGFLTPAASLITSLDVAPVGGGSLTSTTTNLTASSTAVAAGASMTLTATESPSAATGTVTFKDGSTTLGTATLSSGSAAYVVSGITAGSHSYTASYGGNSNYAASTSGAVSVTASGPYVHTTFNEYAAGHALNGTVPATAPEGSSWSDPNGDWTFKSGSGMQTTGADLGNPILINASAASYTATLAFSPANNLYALFRYVDLSNYLFVRAYSGEMDLFSRIGGSETKVATINPTATGATSVAVTLNGATATISSGGQTASGNIPSSQPISTNVGFLTPGASLITSLDIAP